MAFAQDFSVSHRRACRVARSGSTTLAVILLGLALGALPASADENYFGYVYGAETVPKGGWEVYEWVTLRTGKGEGSYQGLDLYTEVETGLTDRLQASLYVNAVSHHISGVPGLEDRDDLQLQALKTSFKYRLRSPYKDGYGLALYLEPGYNFVDKISGEREDEIELEAKIIWQKNFLDDTVVLAVNYTLESEWEVGGEEEEGGGEHGGHGEEGEGHFNSELAEELSMGVSFRFAPRWFLGTELRAHSEWPGFSSREHLGVFLGPTLHYGSEKWWWTATVLPQIWGWPSGDVRDRVVDEHELLEIRFKLGYNF